MLTQVYVALTCASTDGQSLSPEGLKDNKCMILKCRIKGIALAGMKEQTCQNFNKSGNLSRFLWIENTKEEIMRGRLIRPRMKLDKLLFEGNKKTKQQEMGDKK
jgi:hypothetical protein